MSDQFLFITPEDVLGGNLVHPQMLKDLRGVASIEAARLDELAAALVAEPGFLNEERLVQIVAEHIEDPEQASAAASAIRNLRPGSIDQAIARINAWREASASNRERFPEEAFESLQKNLPVLVREFPAVSRMRKVRRLRGVLGNELEKIELICDARPVFDEEREHIEGVLALTTLKLLYESQNGMTNEIEILFTSTQLSDLITKAQKAQQKLRVMEQSFDHWIDDSKV